ncbi:MAG: hypothetical protein FJ144_00480 [Deltaproteobacteria bacterium]|nr:hypothetical protein [Deltaproteobacteria bacterium]
MTWAHAHLWRHPALAILGVALLLVLPPLAVRAGTRAWASLPLPVPSRRVAVTAAVAAGALFLALGLLFPSHAICFDSVEFSIEVWKGQLRNLRWYLTLASYHGALRAVAAIAPMPIPARTFVPVVNAFATGVAYVALAGAARRLGRTRFEVGVITLLAWTAFGNLQLGLFYVDVYPVAQLAMALFAWTALRALDGDGHPVWPILIAAVGPLFYIGLVLVAPAALVVVAAELRRRGGLARVGVSILAAVVATGGATMPAFGRPFAFRDLLERLVASSGAARGLSPDSSLLPADYLFSAPHALEIVQGWILVDGVGVLLSLTAGMVLLAKALRGPLDLRTLLLAGLVGPVLLYAALMDPLWGPYLDWDLFSYGAVATSLFGAYALVVCGRGWPRERAFLAGLLVAASILHLCARLNALEVDYRAHLAESPAHMSDVDEALAPPER